MVNISTLRYFLQELNEGQELYGASDHERERNDALNATGYIAVEYVRPFIK